jgi:ketosteroid isomerase-like protein
MLRPIMRESVRMANHPNAVLARRLWDGIALGDAPTLRSLLADRCVWRLHGRSPLAGTYVGADSVLDFMARVGELTDELRSELLDVCAGEGGGMIRYAIHATRGSQELETHQIFHFRTRHGLIVEADLVNVDSHAYDRFFLPQ